MDKEYQVGLTREELIAATSALMLIITKLGMKNESSFDDEKEQKQHDQRMLALDSAIAKTLRVTAQSNEDAGMPDGVFPGAEPH